MSRNCVARRNGPGRSRLRVHRPRVDGLRDYVGSKPRRRLARRRRLSRPGTTRSRGGRLLLPSSSCPNGASYADSRDAFAIATVSARTQRLRPLGFPTRNRDRADAYVGGSLRPFLNRTDPWFTTGPSPASNHLHRGTSQVSSRGTCGDTYAIATVSPRLRDQRQTVSYSRSPPYWFGCCGRAAAIHSPR